ncbi:MAG: HAD family hydrolase [Bacteroidaceae bacterium]|nr:HAD family hydrolase [Bacteroidaceae bacterium]
MIVDDKPIVALFDCDGVVVDTESQYSVLWNALGEEFQTGIPEFGHVIKGQTLTHILTAYFPMKETQDRLLERLLAYEKNMKYDYMPGAYAFIQDLRKNGCKVVLVTSSDLQKMSNVYRAHPEFCSLFDRILTSEDFTASKPDPYCYLLGARIFDAPLENCVVFEDSFNGIKAGMSAGIYTVGLATTNSRESISSCCNHVIDDFVGFTYDSMLSLL